jgi:DNA processing protein
LLSADEFAAWFRLLQTPGVGRGTARRLLTACGDAPSVLRATPASLQGLVGATVMQALQVPPPDFDARLAAALSWLAASSDHHVLALGDAAYPSLLLQTADPPLLLYLQGDPSRLMQRAVAIVGSRHATPQGLADARAFGAALSAQGWTVVSGLAQGIDAAAHEGALTGSAGTLAVVGTGLDQVYPARHRELARRIAQHGALLSEFPPGTPPLRENFPQRNRVIAGMSLGTLVVEAALQSGSLITARLASEAGREVFAMPGSIHAPHAKGCHALIKQGAKLVETAQDILEELSPGLARQEALSFPAPSDDPLRPADPLLAGLGHEPVTLDALMARTGWPAAELMARLMTLELEGRVARLPGGLYQQLHAV